MSFSINNFAEVAVEDLKKDNFYWITSPPSDTKDIVHVRMVGGVLTLAFTGDGVLGAVQDFNPEFGHKFYGPIVFSVGLKDLPVMKVNYTDHYKTYSMKEFLAKFYSVGDSSDFGYYWVINDRGSMSTIILIGSSEDRFGEYHITSKTTYGNREDLQDWAAGRGSEALTFIGPVTVDIAGLIKTAGGKYVWKEELDNILSSDRTLEEKLERFVSILNTGDTDVSLNNS